MPAVTITMTVAVTVAVAVPSAITRRTPDHGAVGGIARSGHHHDWRRIILNWRRGVIHRRLARHHRRRGVVNRRLAHHNGWRQTGEAKGNADGPTGMCRSGERGANPNQT